MSRIAQLILAPVFLCGLCAPLLACLDATPVTIEQGSTQVVPPAPPADASSDAADAASPMTCQACLAAPDHPGPGCHDVLAPCEADQTCHNAYHCAIDSGCLVTKSVEEFLQCGLVCAEEAGVVSYADPAAQMTYAIFRCAINACKAYCSFAPQGDASTP